MSPLFTLARKGGLPITLEAAATLDAYAVLVRSYNARLNLVARTDVQHFAERHLLHSLVLTRRPFAPGAHVVDWGTGGGLPLIPLAVVFPDVRFTGVDAVEKKVLAVRAMVRALGLTNVEAWHGRAEGYAEPHAYSVSRATAPLGTLWRWHLPGAVGVDDAPVGDWAPGLVCLKGGDLINEVETLRKTHPHAVVTVEPLGLEGDTFADKQVVAVRTA